VLELFSNSRVSLASLNRKPSVFKRLQESGNATARLVDNPQAIIAKAFTGHGRINRIVRTFRNSAREERLAYNVGLGLPVKNLRQIRRLEKMNRSKRVNFVPPKGGDALK
jgi:hypothetical protein